MRVVRYARKITFQLAEGAVSGSVFRVEGAKENCKSRHNKKLLANYRLIGIFDVGFASVSRQYRAGGILGRKY